MSPGIDDPHAVLIVRMPRERACGGRGHRIDSGQGGAVKANVFSQLHGNSITSNLSILYSPRGSGYSSSLADRFRASPGNTTWKSLSHRLNSPGGRGVCMPIAKPWSTAIAAGPTL